jgi:hypothetical protein
MIRKKLAFAAAPLAAAAALAFGGTAHATPPPSHYYDNSVQASHLVTHTITGTATATDVDDTVQVTGLTGAVDTPVTYAIESGGVIGTVTLTLSAGDPGSTVINAAGTIGAPQAGTVVLTATDADGDVAVVSVPVAVTTNTVQLASPLSADGGASTDQVTGISVTDDNTAGAVVFTSAPPGADVNLTNLPYGLVHTNPLTRGTAVPGIYTGVEVTATDTAGAVATGTLTVTVNGHKAAPAPVPVLSHGAAMYVSPAREDVSFESTLPTWVKITIVGPGAINGHTGWVYAQGGDVLNTAAYAGLEPQHTYTVIYQPYSAQNGTPIAGAHYGYVVFVAGQQ